MNEKRVPTSTARGGSDLRERDMAQTIEPPVDIFEVNDGLIVVADLPGVNKDGADVRVDNGLLTIQGKVQSPASGEPLFSEFNLMNYYRQFRLNEEVDQDKIKADMKHGVLTIQLPKMESAKPKRIAVKVS